MKRLRMISVLTSIILSYAVSIGISNPIDENSDSTITFDMIGYATIGDSTTGGAGGVEQTITTLAELEAWASTRENNTNPETVYIQGKISAATSTMVTVKHGENVSIIGIDSTAELENVGITVWDYKNVIVRNLKVHHVLGKDALAIKECEYVWVDHCDLYSEYGVGVDDYDGLLDITHGTKNMTVSWCYIHDHMKTCLIGHSNTESNAATDSLMRITMHHNYFTTTDGRNPSLRFGAVHYYNNYLENISDYGFAIRKRAHALIENNHFHSVNIPVATDKFDDELVDQGFACLNDNIYSGTCSAYDNSITKTDCNYWNNLPYSYIIQDADLVEKTVKQYVGVGKIHLDPYIPTHDTSNVSVGTFSINEININTIYPHPVKISSIISFTLAEDGWVNIFLSDYTGRQVKNITNEKFNKGKNQIKITREGLKTGFHVLMMEYNGYIVSKKIHIH